MKNLLKTIIVVMLLAGCSNEQLSHITSNVLKITKIVIDEGTSLESKNEISKIGNDGLRLLEFETQTNELLQQSIWKMSGGQWAPETEIKPVDGGHIVAVYPAGEAQTGNERVFKAGVNNMIGIADINRKTDNTADIKLTHQMCQVELRVKDKKGREINQGDGKGHIKSATLAQPADMTFDINEGALKSVGAMQDMAFNLTANNYIVTGGKDYLLTAIYINSEGEEIGYSYKPDMTFVKNKKFVITLTMDTEDKDAQLEVSVSVEEWDVEEFEAEFVKEDDSEGPIAFEWAEIPAGEFIMGSEKGYKSEKPIHKVIISKSFLMSRYPVTFEQYDEFCEKTNRIKPKGNEGKPGNYPVVNVSWHDAQAFCEWAGVRLPTEAEWEYACRAGSTTEYYWGDEMEEDNCWYIKNSDWSCHPVGEKKPNAWGLYDMSGNVWEWCADWFENYDEHQQVNPAGPEDGTQKIRRGAGFADTASSLRSSYRASSLPTYTMGDQGFRVVKDIEETPVQPVKIYRQGDKIPAGTYIAYVKSGVKYASESYKGTNIFGALISNGSRWFVVSPTECKNKSWQHSTDPDVVIDGVVTTDKPSESEKDFAGRSNSKALITWRNAVKGRTTGAATAADEYIYEGVTNWYLPSAGEMRMIIDNKEKINAVLSVCHESVKIQSQQYWTSTQFGQNHAWKAFTEYDMIGNDIKAMYNPVRPIIEF